MSEGEVTWNLIVIIVFIIIFLIIIIIRDIIISVSYSIMNISNIFTII